MTRRWRSPPSRPVRRDRRRGTGSLPGWSQISVAIAPGTMRRTSTPVDHRSTAITSDQPCKANFEAAYAASLASRRGRQAPHVDDHAAVALQHAGQHGQAQRHGREEVGAHHVVDGIRRQALHGPPHRPGGVVDHGVEVAEGIPGLDRQPGGGIGVGQVDGPHPVAVTIACASCDGAARQASSTPDSRSVRRAAMPTVAPLPANIGASAAPMPEDAPVTRILAPSDSAMRSRNRPPVHRPEAIRPAQTIHSD